MIFGSLQSVTLIDGILNDEVSCGFLRALFSPRHRSLSGSRDDDDATPSAKGISSTSDSTAAPNHTITASTASTTASTARLCATVQR